jgi:hypothetical protein
MFRRNRQYSDEASTVTRVDTARGGVLFGPIITGVLVALGAMFLLSAIIAGVISSLGYADEIQDGESFRVGVAGAAALIVAQLLAYLWGGYTAGRMSRGAGAANGLLVPIAAIALVALVGGIAALLGATTNLNLPFSDTRLPVETDLLIDWGIPVGIASLAAMLVGGAIGGILGVRWHTKLERTVALEQLEEPAPYTTREREDHAAAS